MKYMLLIHHGRTPDLGGLSEDEQKQMAADYKAVSTRRRA